jgi:hypothetical protein
MNNFIRFGRSFLERLDRKGVCYAPRGEWEPNGFKQLFGIFTIPQAKHNIA